jgi:hypothetical protein
MIDASAEPALGIHHEYCEYAEEGMGGVRWAVLSCPGTEIAAYFADINVTCGCSTYDIDT